MSIDTAPGAEHSRVGRLAKQLELDIRRRGLRQGDTYLTADGVSALLGISRMTANRAMNVLANRQLLVRHRSRGTFVGPAVEERGGDAAEGSNPMGASKCIHYITLIDHSPALQLPLGEIVEGLRTSFPDVSLKTHTVPLRNALDYVRHEIEQASREPFLGGIVLALGTRNIQEYLAKSGLPVVIYGSVFPGVNLPSVDVDQRTTGRLLAQQAIQAGHRRLVFVGRELWRPGDNQAFDGIQEAAHAAGLGHDGVTVRNIPTALNAIGVEIDHLLEEVGPGAAFLCRLPFFARAIAAAAQTRGWRIPDEIGIVYDQTTEEGTRLPFPGVCCQTGIKERYAMIGQMLSAIASGHAPSPYRVLISVKEDEGQPQFQANRS
jgi:DNA-binding LacI/PurR family transcriptional regulator